MDRQPYESSAGIKPRDPARYPAADHELSADEIETKYGDLIAQALADFHRDPRYLTSMAVRANRRAADADRRAARAAKSKRKTSS